MRCYVSPLNNLSCSNGDATVSGRVPPPRLPPAVAAARWRLDATSSKTLLKLLQLPPIQSIKASRESHWAVRKLRVHSY